VRENLAAINALESRGGVVGGRVVTPQEQRAYGPAALMAKKGEVGLTHLQPGQGHADKKPVDRKATIQKSAEALETTVGQPGEQPKKLPQSRDLKPHVDVSNQEPPKVIKEKQAQHYAPPELEVYPLDGYDEVQKAASYFDTYGPQMSPVIRREFAVNMVKRAHQLSIPVSDLARKYGSDSYAPEGELKIAMEMRRRVVDEEMADMLESLEEKRASVDPEVFCETLKVLDKVAEIDWRYDRDVWDPYLSTFGFEKNAEDEAWCEGNDYINKQQVENYAKTGLATLRSDYGDDFVKEFKKDPWGIFKSLPLEQKKRMVRAATDNSPTGTANVA
jgi:hypothetical protein